MIRFVSIVLIECVSSLSSPLFLLLSSLFFIFIDSFCAGVNKGLLFVYRLLKNFLNGEHFFWDDCTKNRVCLLSIIVFKHLIGIHYFHFMYKCLNILMEHVSLKSLTIADWRLKLSITNNVKYCIMVWDGGYWDALLMSWINIKIVSHDVINQSGGFIGHPGWFHYQWKRH